jgi:hypothetical protein
MQADAPRPRAVHHVVVPAASPAPVLDDEHKRPTLEQRLDAAILAAATPSHTQKSPKALVPLRLDAPSAQARPDGVDRAPAPRMLQFLLEDVRHSDDTSSRLRVQPVAETGKTRVGVHTNVYRLDSALSDDSCPSRPLPLVSEEPATWVGKPVSKVMSRVGDAVAVHAFSFIDEDPVDDDTAEGPYVDRAPHAPAAVGLHALSDEGEGDFGDDAEVSSAHLDELAAQLGLVHLAVPRVTRNSSDDDGVDLAALARSLHDEAENSDRSGEAFTSLTDEPAIGDGLDDLDDDGLDDDDLNVSSALNDARAALKVTDPMRVLRRPNMPSIVVSSDLQDAADADEDDDLFDPLADDEPSNTVRLPASLMSSFDDDTEVTPPHGTQRPSLQAPDAVRFVVAEAPARPRKAALTAEDLERNKARAHDLYLVALDDIACRDHDSAVVHLQLALAYDDETSLYGDLLAQIEKSHKRAS